MKDYYKVLGVSRDASKHEIVRKYHELAKKYHPDISPKTGKKFQRITEAYSVLNDPSKRSEYDAQLIKQIPASGEVYFNFTLFGVPVRLNISKDSRNKKRRL